MKKHNPFLDMLIGFFMSLLTFLLAIFFVNAVLNGAGHRLWAAFLLLPLGAIALVGVVLWQARLTAKYKNRGFVQLGIWLVYPIAIFSFQPLMDFNKDRKAQIRMKKAVYYRLKASYRHKDRNTGKMEKIEFDLVADLNVKYFMKPTADGGAVLIHLPEDAYYKDYRTSHVPGDYMPFAVWFDDVHDTHFGWGYANEEAYQSARSELKFDGATLTKQNYTQWQAWRKTQKQAFRPVGSIQSPFGFDGYRYDNLPEVKTRSVAIKCWGHRRIVLPKVLQEQADHYWPKGKTVFWGYYHVGYDFIEARRDNPKANRWRENDKRLSPRYGVRRNSGRGNLKKIFKGKAPLYYPAFKDLSYPAGPSDRIRFTSRMKGFVACDGYITDKSDRLNRFYINNSLLKKSKGQAMRNNDGFFERNKYLWLKFPNY